MQGARLKLVDEQEKIFLQAWVNRQAKAQKKGGRYYYRTFNQFFNRKKIEQQMENNASENSSLVSRMQKAIDLYKKKGGE